MIMTAVIIGAGIIGLSTAVELQKTFPHLKVVIIAENISPETTSDIAAGHLHPYLEGDTDPNLLKRWFCETFKYMQKICKESEAVKYGVNCTSGFELSFDKQENLPYWHDIVRNFRRIPYTELVEYGWPQFRDGFFFTTYTLEPSQYLAYLLEEFTARGGKLINRKLTSLDEIKNICKCDFDLIINATGLGSYFLFDDKKLFPFRGQIYRVKAPFQKYFISSPNNYILLNNNQVILGGTRQANDYRLSIDEADSRKIWDGCLKLVPSLKVIHCYGHGGSGISLFYGCVEDVLDLCRGIFLKTTSKL
uniref:FAD dependent oxidoreductase domain-containing protein n=1 Tax=Romanomermis culicivorax TaxID=13658 RepID=A0A915HYF4_ROMCU